MATSFKPSEKEGQIGNRAIYDQIPTIWWKSGENRSTSWDLIAHRSIF